MADRQQAHDRLKRGWEKKYNVKASKTFANFVKFDCNEETTQTSRALIYPSNIINNVMFVSIVWYITTMNRPSQTINVRGTKHIFRNGLRISVLDEDLSQAQLAQLEEFLDLDVDFVLEVLLAAILDWVRGG